MRELTSHKVKGLNEAITIAVMDEPGAGGACHEYNLTMDTSPGLCIGAEVRFQKGPIAEVGVNGVSNESLLAIVEDRLVGFQSGQFACR